MATEAPEKIGSGSTRIGGDVVQDLEGRQGTYCLFEMLAQYYCV